MPSCGLFDTRLSQSWIAPTSLSRQCVFFLPNMSESVKHKIWDCIQVQRTWQWATCIMYELCGVHTNNFDHFHSKQTLFGREFLRGSPGKLRFDTFSMTSLFGLFRLSMMITCATKNNGMSLRLNTTFGMTSFCTPRWLGRG